MAVTSRYPDQGVGDDHGAAVDVHRGSRARLPSPCGAMTLSPYTPHVSMGKSGPRSPSPFWYDVMIALIYPSVLGAVIFSFVDVLVRYGLLPFLNVRDDDGARFLSSLRLGDQFEAVAFIALTAAVVIHFSADFLYSLYSKASYTWHNFAFDTCISILLAVSYVTLTALSRQDEGDVRVGFAIFWLSFAGVYVAFLAWDALAQTLSRTSGERRFYLQMIFPFEVMALATWLALAGGALFLGRLSETYDRVYVTLGIVALTGFGIWLALKTRALRDTPDSLADAGAIDHLEVRRTVPGDIAECSVLMQSAYALVYNEVWSLPAARRRLDELLAHGDGYCLTLILSGRISGFIFARPFAWHDGTRLWLEEIVVAEARRSQGWGSLLMRTLDELARSRGLSGLDLISARGSRPHALYRRLGYRISDWEHLERDL